VAQEFAQVWTARKRDTDPAKPPQFSFTKQQRRVTVFYASVWDDDFGPAFIKLCAYFPYPIKVSRQRPRMGQAAGRQGRDRLHRTVQRVRCLRRPRRLAGHL
jgi:hypothetical protein